MKGYVPVTEEAVFFWMAVVTLVYLAAANWLQYTYAGWFAVEHYFLPRIFDGITFAGSALLLLALFDSHVMLALGNTKPFLFAAGITGVAYGLLALRPR